MALSSTEKSNRIRAGMATAKEMGTHCGRPRKQLPEARQEQIVSLLATNRSVLSIARELHIPKSTLYRQVAQIRAATVTIEETIGTKKKHQPCTNCPWRKSTKTEQIPGCGMDHVRAKAAVGDGLRAMACHKNDVTHVACVGYVLRMGLEKSLGLRLAALKGLFRIDDYDLKFNPKLLHGSMEEMLAAHPHRE